MTTNGSAERLNEHLVSAGLPELNSATLDRFLVYLDVLVRWNSRLNLTSIRDREGILSRHFVESIACAHAIPAGVATLLDFGSGAGFPGIPIALCRPEIQVTLAESQAKKAAFLREAIRALSLDTHIFSGRAENIGTTFDCVAMRAVEQMERAVGAASGLVRVGGVLALMVSGRELPKLHAAAGNLEWFDRMPLLESRDRFISIGERRR